MKTTFRVLFYLRKNRLNGNRMAPIMVRITINGEMSQFNSKLSVLPEQWDTKLGRCSSRAADALNLNRTLDRIKVRMEEIYQEQLKEKGYVCPESIKNILLGLGTARAKSFIEYFTEHNDHYKLKVGKTTSQKTYSRYELTKNKLQEFMRVKYNITDVMPTDINSIFIESFYLYLMEHSCNNNTAMKFVQRLRTVFDFAVNSGAEIKINPFAQFKFKYDKVSREVLTQDEIDTIYKKEFTSKRLTQVRDLFIFCCYTGLAYTDACKLTAANIRKSFDGNLWVITKRTKTKIDSNIMLLDIPIQIIDKYTGEDKEGKLIPSCSNQKMNEYLKEIAEICGIEKAISTHIARHTFATTVTLANGVPIESVSKMLGHNSIRTTQIYAKVLDMKVSQDMSNLALKLNRKKQYKEKVS